MRGAQRKLPRPVEQQVRAWYRKKQEIGTMKAFCHRNSLPYTVVQSVVQRMRQGRA